MTYLVLWGLLGLFMGIFTASEVELSKRRKVIIWVLLHGPIWWALVLGAGIILKTREWLKED